MIKVLKTIELTTIPLILNIKVQVTLIGKKKKRTIYKDFSYLSVTRNTSDIKTTKGNGCSLNHSTV